MASSSDIVIVGAGQAAAQLVMSLRTARHEGKITLIGDEPHVPYSRPPLSKTFLGGQTEIEDLFFRTPDWYADQNVQLMTGVRVTAIDKENRKLETTSGPFAYGQLVLATGTRPRILPSLPDTLTNVVYLRAVADIDRLRPLLTGPRRVAVVGGGFIGLEFAAAARKLGHEVTVIEAGPRLMGRAVSSAMSDWFLRLHQSHGVDVRLSTGLEHVIEENGAVKALGLSDGSRIDADLVVAGVGAIPNEELADAAGIRCDNGISVAPDLQTSENGIFAIGDCCSFLLPDGRRIRLECVQNAVDQARHLAAVLTGNDTAPYTAVPWFWTHQFGAKLQIAGLLPAPCAKVTCPTDADRFSLDHHKGDQLICRESFNDPKAHVAARKAMKADLSQTIPSVAARA